jgi:hypothetical protein
MLSVPHLEQEGITLSGNPVSQFVDRRGKAEPLLPRRRVGLQPRRRGVTTIRIRLRQNLGVAIYE